MGNLNFNASDFEPHNNYELIPAGWYLMHIVASEMKESLKAGSMLRLTFECDSHRHPSLLGRKVFSNLCLNHPSEIPRSIASRSLSSICQCLNHSHIENSEDLLGGALMVRLEKGQARDGYDAQNEVRGYRSLTSEPVEEVATTKGSRKKITDVVKSVVDAINEKTTMKKSEPLPTRPPVPSIAPRRIEPNLSQWAKKPPVKDDEIPF